MQKKIIKTIDLDWKEILIKIKIEHVKLLRKYRAIKWKRTEVNRIEVMN
jgi:hypothetical protein